MTVTERLIDFVGDLTLFLSLFYPILYIRGFTKFGKAFKYFTIYLVLIALIQLSQKYFNIFYKGENNIFLFFYYIIFQFVSLSMFYHELLKKKFIKIVSLIVLFFLAVQYILDPSLYFRYNAVGVVVTQFTIVGYSLVYFYNSLTKNKTEFVYINSALFIYLLVSYLIFASGNLVFDINIPRYVSKTLGQLNEFFYLGFQIVIIIEWWKNYSFPSSIKTNS